MRTSLLRLGWLTVIGAHVTACATLTSADKQPVVVTAQNQAGEPQEIFEGPSAAVLLKRAFTFFEQDENMMAIAMFRAAINTGNLNDAGRALAYWHIYVAYTALSQPEDASEALLMFTVVAQDVLDVREQMRYADEGHGDFVQRFDLSNRLARARASLSASWAKQAEPFGRTARQPVLVHDATEKNFFLEIAAMPCAGRHLVTAPVVDHVEQVNMSCDGQPTAQYFFQTVGDASLPRP
jgi:hypothetical protein